jgi:hypothetical protein
MNLNRAFIARRSGRARIIPTSSSDFVIGDQSVLSITPSPPWHQHRHGKTMRIMPSFCHTFITTKSMSRLIDLSDETPQSAEHELLALQQIVNQVLHSSQVLPDEEIVQSILQKCESFARSITQSSSSSLTPANSERSPTLTLLSLEKPQEDTETLNSATPYLPASIRKKIETQISELADSIVYDPKVFITLGILSKYVSTQVLLRSPRNIPQVFTLYASKPIAQSRGNSIKTLLSNSAKPSSAIPFRTAKLALDSAIAAKDLPLCFDIINTSVCTAAFRRSKIVRRAVLPIAALGVTPVAAYALASQLALHQNTMDTAMATNIAFAGILAYVWFTSTIGIVAITTANDQMKRITWVSGTPLRERWLREEERTLIDHVAEAWGFQETWKRGEEEGQDWETLREWVGLRGMILDRVELMEGME